MVHQLREAVDEYIGHNVSPEMIMLYGGSVTNENSERFAKSSEIDGVLLGGASINANEFLKVASVFHGRSERES